MLEESTTNMLHLLPHKLSHCALMMTESGLVCTCLALGHNHETCCVSVAAKTTALFTLVALWFVEFH